MIYSCFLTPLFRESAIRTVPKLLLKPDRSIRCQISEVLFRKIILPCKCFASAEGYPAARVREPSEYLQSGHSDCSAEPGKNQSIIITRKILTGLPGGTELRRGQKIRSHYIIYVKFVYKINRLASGRPRTVINDESLPTDDAE